MSLMAGSLPGVVQTLSGTAITNAYLATASMTAIQIARCQRVRFSVFVFTAPASNLTTVTVKLQQRYNDGGIGGGAPVIGLALDLPSTLDDVQGAAQPKGGTFEIEHAFTVAANNTPGVWFSFLLDKPAAIMDLFVNLKANAAGIAGDKVQVFAAQG